MTSKACAPERLPFHGVRVGLLGLGLGCLFLATAHEASAADTKTLADPEGPLRISLDDLATFPPPCLVDSTHARLGSCEGVDPGVLDMSKFEEAVPKVAWAAAVVFPGKVGQRTIVTATRMKEGEWVRLRDVPAEVWKETAGSPVRPTRAAERTTRKLDGLEAFEASGPMSGPTGELFMSVVVVGSSRTIYNFTQITMGAKERAPELGVLLDAARFAVKEPVPTEPPRETDLTPLFAKWVVRGLMVLVPVAAFVAYRRRTAKKLAAPKRDASPRA